MIDQIYRFEYLNDLSKNTTLEKMIREQLERVNYVDPYDNSKTARRKRRLFANTDLKHYDNNELANVLNQKDALEDRNHVKKRLERDLAIRIE